jgi:hypothetical protein
MEKMVCGFYPLLSPSLLYLALLASWREKKDSGLIPSIPFIPVTQFRSLCVVILTEILLKKNVHYTDKQS